MADRPHAEPYPHAVRIRAGGVTLAASHNAHLLRHGYAPDIYLAASDVALDLLRESAVRKPAPDGAETVIWFDAKTPDGSIEAVGWQRQQDRDFPELSFLFSFDFNKVQLDVDGRQVRGHVRDPHKMITVSPVPGRLRMSLGDRWVVDSTAALVLCETGLPARYYVPPGDIAADVLVPSDRVTVCTYKGEATYHHLQGPAGLAENAVWTYADPWTDFAADIARIKGHRGLYASAFDRITLDGRDVERSAGEVATDKAMIAKPTVDAVLRDKTQR